MTEHTNVLKTSKVKLVLGVGYYYYKKCQLTKCPCFMSPTFFWTLSPHRLTISISSDKIFTRVLSLRREASGSLRPLFAEVAVVLHHSPIEFAPHMALQQRLVGTLAPPRAPAERVRHDCCPDELPCPPAPGQSCPPETTKNGDAVTRMVSHDMECLFTFQPLIHCLDLACFDRRVKIS